MSRPLVRYRSADEDSARWAGFRFRDGDIVISTRSKSGTTWMQMICALLVFQTPDLPAPLATLSPWLDHAVEPIDAVLSRLESQNHRRFVKTHTPLDGVPIDDRATYVVVARHPLDLAVSLYHHSDNIDRSRLRELTGAPELRDSPPPRPPLEQWLVQWVERETTPQEQMDSLPGVLHHLSDAWARRQAANVVLVHYADLQGDLEGEMRSLGGRLGIEVPEKRWPVLVKAASFASMKERASALAPDQLGVLKDPAAFFRAGLSGSGRALLPPEAETRYFGRMASMPPELLAWLHRE